MKKNIAQNMAAYRLGLGLLSVEEMKHIIVLLIEGLTAKAICEELTFSHVDEDGNLRRTSHLYEPMVHVVAIDHAFNYNG